jgi:hypothetical protein
MNWIGSWLKLWSMKEQSENGSNARKHEEEIAGVGSIKAGSVQPESEKEQSFQCGMLTHGIASEMKKER